MDRLELKPKVTPFPPKVPVLSRPREGGRGVRSAVLLFIAVPVLVSLACASALGGPAAPTLPAIVTAAATQPGAATQFGAATQAGATSEPTTDPNAQPTALAEELFGPGPFNLADPTVGLAGLAGYRATLTITFDGARDGAGQHWTKTYVMLAAREPAARQLSLDKLGDLPDAVPVFRVEQGGVAYELHGEQGCLASVLNPDDSLAQFEPASLLTGVLGAAEAGQETVNDVAANHYTFDERALGQLGLAKSNGELWVAAEGGYLVRYALSTTGDAGTFGAGVEGVLRLDYELTAARGSEPAAIAAPPDCPAGLLSVPQLPDAADIQSTPGLLVYTSAANLADAIAFYLAHLPAQAWQLSGDPAALGTPTPDQTTAVLDFTQTNQSLTVILTTTDSGTQVRIVQSSAAQ